MPSSRTCARPLYPLERRRSELKAAVSLRWIGRGGRRAKSVASRPSGQLPFPVQSLVSFRPARARPSADWQDSNDQDSLYAEAEVELPGADARCEFAAFVGEGEAELDDAEEVDVAPERLVVVVARASEGPDRSCDDAWELGVLLREGGSVEGSARVGLGWPGERKGRERTIATKG